ncbi:hypothetical protein J7U46_05620 [Pelomonas sp. V22]|uniref:hypothetical protein n=1 Tax=Pelomonas sp. V22 TaxID=2822139 RepID=UPI0024A8A57F|nr:hypothetical protein [Pelomonas sp. V22]MDI4632516.1 hypothetical protein [Pelomonas sp. V22]
MTGTMNEDAVSGDDTGVQGRWLRGYLLALALAASAAAAGGYLLATRSPTGSAEPVTTSAGSASAPKAAARPAQPQPAGAEAAAKATWPLWEFRLREPIAPRDPPLTPPSWRLIGASATGGAWRLIVLREGKSEPEFFRVGDKLPGDYRIEAISEEDVTLKRGRRELVLSYIASR